jgi:ABC-type glycerol-3-phosphate transport system permease component
VINVVPILLVLRQALAPESESSAWPLHLIPARISLANLVSLWRTQSLLSGSMGRTVVATGRRPSRPEIPARVTTRSCRAPPTG